MKIIYRNYIDSDSVGVNALALLAFEQYSDNYYDWDGFKKKISLMSQLAKTSDLIVAEQNHQVVGAIAYIAPNEPKSDFFSHDWAAIRMLIVSPKARNQGVGRTLTNMCIERAKCDNANTIALHTSTIMEVALSMYLRMGFSFHSKTAKIHGVEYGVYTLNT